MMMAKKLFVTSVVAAVLFASLQAPSLAAQHRRATAGVVSLLEEGDLTTVEGPLRTCLEMAKRVA